jgi:ribosomal protein L12E/L44/L45/RPP1/RPP2
MGFNIAERHATIYDAGTEEFTGTTLEGIGQSVVGVLSHPAETANRFVKVRSIQTSQNELLEAFEKVTTTTTSATTTNNNSTTNTAEEKEGEKEEKEEGDKKWQVSHSTAQQLLVDGRKKHAEGGGRGWVLDLLVFQLYAPDEARCVVASSREESDSPLLGVREESADEVVEKARRFVKL